MIVSGNVSALNAIKGVGIKTAQRIIVDLKDKIVKGSGSNDVLNLASNELFEQRDEAVSALVILGFSTAASQKTVDKIIREQPTIKVEQVIKLALKMM
jgi:Holliday junction DNA helicase RuvA